MTTRGRRKPRSRKHSKKVCKCKKLYSLRVKHTIKMEFNKVALSLTSLWSAAAPILETTAQTFVTSSVASCRHSVFEDYLLLTQRGKWSQKFLKKGP